MEFKDKNTSLLNDPSDSGTNSLYSSTVEYHTKLVAARKEILSSTKEKENTTSDKSKRCSKEKIKKFCLKIKPLSLIKK